MNTIERHFSTPFVNKNSFESQNIQTYKSVQSIQKIQNGPTISQNKQFTDEKNQRFDSNQRQTSRLQHYLNIHFDQRTSKIEKRINYYFSGFKCFNIFVSKNSQQNNNIEDKKRNQQFLSKDNFFPINIKNNTNQIQEILKQDLNNLKSVFSKYSKVSFYKKSQIIDVTGENRQNIKILLKGKIGIYQPINKTALSNSLERFKNRETIKYQIKRFNKIAKKIAQSEGYFEKQFNLLNFLKNYEQDDKKMSQFGAQFQNILLQKFNSLIQILISNLKINQLDEQTCTNIFQACEIITLVTPHKRTLTLTQQGELLTSIKTPSLLLQQTQQQSYFSSICLSDQAILVQLNFQKFKQVLQQINNNQQNMYISCLMKNFSCMNYFEAKKYLKQKQNMIDYFGVKVKKQKKNTIRLDKKMQTNLRTNPIANNQNVKINPQSLQKIENQKTNSGAEIASFKESIQTFNSLQLIQTHCQYSSLYFTLPYTNDLYLIVQGEVVLVISQIKIIQTSDQKFSQPKKIFKRRQIIRLYQNDIFGVQKIGQIKGYSLRYQVKKQSKILKIKNQIFQKHLRTIPNLKQQFERMKNKRDQLLQNFLSNISLQIQKQMFKKDWKSQKQIIQRSISSPKLRKSIQFFSENSITSHLKKKSSFSVLQNYYTQQKKVNLQNKKELFASTISKFSLKQTFRDNVIQEQILLQKKLKPLKLNSFQYIGEKNLKEMKIQLEQKNNTIEKQKFKSKYASRLTVELLKQLNLVEFKDQIKVNNQNKEIKNTFIEMRNQDGTLIRRKFIPSLEKLETSKNRHKVQEQIFKKIGMLSEEQQVKHNHKFVKKRKSELKYQNAAETQRKQFKRLSKVSKSLPKLQHFYSKKAQIHYENQNKKKFLA